MDKNIAALVFSVVNGYEPITKFFVKPLTAADVRAVFAIDSHFFDNFGRTLHRCFYKYA